MARKQDWNPNVGPWLRAQRGKRKQDAVIADLAKRGVVIGRSWLSRAENGAPMSEELLAAFEDYYGSVAPPYEPSTASPTVDASGLAALLEQQATAQWQTAEAIRELIGVLREALGQPAPDPLVEEALAAVAERDPQFGRPRPQSTSQPRKRGRDRLAEERRRESREGEAT